MTQNSYAKALHAIEIIFRSLTKDDAEDYRALRLKALASEGHWYTANLQEESAQSPTEWEKLCTETADQVIFGAFQHGLLIGTTVVEAYNDHTVRWKSTYVVPAFRGSGVAERLFETCAEWCHERGFEEAVFTIRVDNKRSRDIQERNGAVIIGEELKEFADGTIANVYWYKKDLNAAQPMRKQAAS